MSDHEAMSKVYRIDRSTKAHMMLEWNIDNEKITAQEVREDASLFFKRLDYLASKEFMQELANHIDRKHFGRIMISGKF